MQDDARPFHRETGLRSSPRATVAALLRERSDDLLLRWEQSIREDSSVHEKRLEFALSGEIPPLLEEIVFALDELDEGDGRSPPDAASRVPGAGGRIAEETLAEHGLLCAALRGFSRLRRLLVDLFFVEAVVPTRAECHAIERAIDLTAVAIAARIRDQDSASLSAMRDRFFAILGHDLRVPLNVLTLSATALQRGPLPEFETRLASRVVSSAARMEKMIEDLLEVTAVRHGTETFTPNRESGLLSRFCGEAVEDMRILHPSKVIDLDVQCQGEGLWDGHRILRVLSNLLGNAIAYGAPGSKVTVTVARQAERMLVRVHNEGAPIEPKVASTIFTPFERGPATSGKPSGLGLGLFIARQIARAQSGDVRLESSAEKGTTFTIELPIVEDPALALAGRRCESGVHPTALGGGEPCEIGAYSSDAGVPLRVALNAQAVCTRWSQAAATGARA